MALGSIIGGLGGGLLGGLGFGLMSGIFGHSANQQQAEFANANLRLQREMAETAMQKRVRDLAAAGLNPMLAVGGMGAAQASGGTSVPQMRNIGEAASAAGLKGIEAQALAAQIDKTRAETTLASAAAQRERSQALLNIRTVGDKLPAEVGHLTAGAESLTASAGQARAMTDKTRAELPKIEAEIQEITARANLAKQQTLTEAFHTDIRELDHYERANIVPHLIRMMQLERDKLEMTIPGAENRKTAQESGFARLLAALGFAPSETSNIMQLVLGMTARPK